MLLKTKRTTNNMKTTVLAICLLGSVNFAYNQNNVGIGTTTPDASSALDIEATDQGLLVPRIALLATNNNNPVAAPATSLLVYNTATAGVAPNDVTPGYYFWDGTQWVRLLNGPASTSCVTLDEAYDCATPGGGRVVTVNDGSVEFNQTGGANTEVLTVTTDQGNATTANVGIFSDMVGIGNAIIGVTANPSADALFAPVVGSAAASTTANTGVLGTYDGSSNFGSGGTFLAASNDGGIGSINLNDSPSVTGTAVGSYGWVVGGGANNFGLQGVVGDGTGAINVFAGTITSAGVYGHNESASGGAGVYGEGVNGVVGLTDYADGFGLWGQNFGNQTVAAPSQAVGVLGDGGYGVWGQSQVLEGVGVYGLNNTAFLPPAGFTPGGNVNAATAGAGAGVVGECTDPADWGVIAIGDMGATGVKPFIIDHPLDPENKALKHFALESNEVLNVYRGTIEFDANGEAIVTLPNYFEAININFSYQLTPVGSPSPSMYVSKEVEGNSFKISGGTPNAKVSWTVYAERNDKYLQKYPQAKVAELDKDEKTQGKYYDTGAYDKPRSQAVFGGDAKVITPEEKLNTKKEEAKLPNVQQKK